MAHKPASTALSDITVTDLTRRRSGPTTLRQFADRDTDVSKVKMPEALVPGDVEILERFGGRADEIAAFRSRNAF